jgi:AcrR family transcriptional regulator
MSGTRDAKARLMDATVRLLREGGVQAATPAAIAERAGAGKMSLYRHFDGKDAVLTESLRDYAATQREGLLGPDDVGEPRERVLAIFDRLAGWADEGVLSPCIYVTTRLEVADACHPVAEVTSEYKRQVAAALAATLAELGHPSPEPTARVIAMLIDGAVIHSIIEGGSRPVREARATVETLLDR